MRNRRLLRDGSPDDDIRGAARDSSRLGELSADDEPAGGDVAAAV
jgi:hypothetical protein